MKDTQRFSEATLNYVKQIPAQRAVISINPQPGDTWQELSSPLLAWGTTSEGTSIETNMLPYSTVESFSSLLALAPLVTTLPCPCERGTVHAWEQCSCGCADQTDVFMAFVFVQILVTTLRVFWLSFAAMKASLLGKGDSLTMSPKGIREHMISLLMIMQLVFAAVFFVDACPDDWAEWPLLISAITIFALMWMPFFVRVVCAKDGNHRKKEMSRDIKLLYRYFCGNSEDNLAKYGDKPTPALNVIALHNTPATTPMPTPRLRGSSAGNNSPTHQHGVLSSPGSIAFQTDELRMKHASKAEMSQPDNGSDSGTSGITPSAVQGVVLEANPAMVGVELEADMTMEADMTVEADVKVEADAKIETNTDLKGHV